MKIPGKKLFIAALAALVVLPALPVDEAQACGGPVGIRHQANSIKGPLRFQAISYTILNRKADRVSYRFYITNVSDKPVWLPAGLFLGNKPANPQSHHATRPQYSISLRYPGKKWQTYLQPNKGSQPDILLRPKRSIMLGSGNFVVSKNNRLDDMRMPKSIPNYSPRAQLQLIKQLPQKIRLVLPYRTERNGSVHKAKIVIKQKPAKIKQG